MKVGITDLPETSTARELLGLTDHIEALVQFICQCSTPMTIAIQGDWGTGKTTIMNMIKSRLPKILNVSGLIHGNIPSLTCRMMFRSRF